MRKVINLLLVFMLGTTLVGCSSQIKTTKKTTENSNVKSESQTQKTYHDKEFINDVYALIGNSELDKDYSDVDFDNLSQQEKDKVIKDQQIVFIQQKIDKIKKYKKLDFKNPELKELAIRYIDVLETQKQLIEDDKVKAFVGEYKPDEYLLNKDNPIAVGPLDLQAYLFEHKAQQAEAMKNAKKVILDVAKDFEKMTGRKYSFFEEYKLDDADIAIVCMNSTAGTTKYVVDNLREKGIKAGLLEIRVFRPFPAEEIAKALENVKAVAVLDKADSLNAAGGALFEDVTSAMYVNKKQVPMVNYVYGIGGRDTKADDIEGVYNDLAQIAKTGEIDNPYRYLGLRK